MVLLVYSLLIRLLAPLVWLSNIWRGFRDRSYWERLGERFGYTDLGLKDSLWIHAVSVGEVQASAVLIKTLQQRYPHMPLLMTTATPTGAARVKALFGDSVRHCYLPYDLPGAVRRFLTRTQPRLGVIMETELWPTLYHECRRHRIPLLIANARISPRSLPRYQRLRALLEPILATVHIAAQTDEDAERFRTLGARPDNVHIAGNLKFDIEIPAAIVARGAEFRAAEAPSRPVWIAASTHAGEEQAVLAAHAKILEALPRTLLILVPRHPQRFAEVQRLLESGHQPYALYSSRQPIDERTAVVLVDTMGDLLMFYAASDVAFVGGSLVPVGGHSFLEPASLGLPILSGPHNFNAANVAKLFFDAGAAVCVHSVEELARSVVELLGDPAHRTAIGNKGRDIVHSNRGAVVKVVTEVERLLGSPVSHCH